MSALTPAGRGLVVLMTGAPRGPKREGIFALWLTVRVVEDLALVPPPPDRAHRRRVAALERRLSSLTLPAPLRRGITGTILALKDAKRAEVPALLSQLAAPVRESIGPEAADLLLRAARETKAKR